jgi:hypothetical protein
MRHRWLATVTVVAALALCPPATSGADSGPALVLAGNGTSIAHLGVRETTAVASLEHVLGEPSMALAPTPGIENCGVDAMAIWHALIAYFNDDRLVGLSLGPGTKPAGRTSGGLVLGDTLARARAIYGTSLRTSTEQGGAWFVKTGEGRLDGFLKPSSGRTPGPSSRILTIDVGDVGCPAMSP